MPNLKDIRRRIKSVKSTQKITQAMKMVAAAKVKRAENRVKAARPYAQEVFNVMSKVYNALKNQGGAFSGSRYVELLSPRPIKKMGIVVVSSDRGLCGSYNSNLVRQALTLEKELISRGLEPKFYLVGNKAIQSFSRYSKSPVLGRMADMTAAPTIHDASLIGETLVKAYLAGEIDSIEVLSTHFISMISYKVKMTAVVPVKGILPEVIASIDPPGETLAHSTEHIAPEMLLEPNATETLDHLMPMYLGNSIYALLLEASASELAARMTAMSNATKNAGEMLEDLTRVYNRLRQSSITQEILEIVGGAEALK